MPACKYVSKARRSTACDSCALNSRSDLSRAAAALVSASARAAVSSASCRGSVASDDASSPSSAADGVKGAEGGSHHSLAESRPPPREDDGGGGELAPPVTSPWERACRLGCRGCDDGHVALSATRLAAVGLSTLQNAAWRNLLPQVCRIALRSLQQSEHGENRHRMRCGWVCEAACKVIRTVQLGREHTEGSGATTDTGRDDSDGG